MICWTCDCVFLFHKKKQKKTVSAKARFILNHISILNTIARFTNIYLFYSYRLLRYTLNKVYNICTHNTLYIFNYNGIFFI